MDELTIMASVSPQLYAADILPLGYNQAPTEISERGGKILG